MQETPKTFSRFVECNHKGGAVKLFIGEIQEGNNAKIASANTRRPEADGNIPLPEVDMVGIFSVDVQGLGLPRKIEDNTVEYSSQVR